MTLTATDVTRSSCMCSPSSSKKSGSNSRTRSNSKAWMFNNSFGSTCPCLHRVIDMAGLIFFNSVSILTNSCSSGTRSILFNKTLSAKATCSTLSFSTPSGLTSSNRSMICFASTTVMTESNEYIDLMVSSTKKVWTTGAGSANPVVSIITPSKRLTRSYKLFKATTKSPRTVQQLHGKTEWGQKIQYNCGGE